MKTSRTILILVAILVLGGLLRGLYLSEIMKHRDFDMPAVDALYHDYWARAIVSGNWAPPSPMDDPEIPTTPYFRSPGYTYFMAAVYRLTGSNYVAIRIAQMLIGLLSCLLAFLLGRRFLGPRAGLLFAALMSVYWSFIYFEGELLEPVLLVALGLWLVYDIARWTETMSFRRAILSGVILGLFALVRPNVLLFAPAVVLWALWVARRRKNVRAFVYASLGLALGSIVTIAPVTIRNYVVACDFVPISSNGGINLYIGNNELANAQCAGHIPGMGSFETCFDYPQIVAGVEKQAGRKLKHSEVSSYFTREAIRYIKAEPGRVLALTWEKALMFWSPVEVGHNKEDELERANSRVLGRIPVKFPLVLALSLVGLTALVLDTRRRRRVKEDVEATDRRYEVSILILLFIATYFISYVPFFAAGRYRVPIVPFLMFFGAYALDYGIALVGDRKLKTALFWALGLCAAYGLASLNPSGYKPDVAKWHYDRAVDLGLAGRVQESIEEYTEALRIRPVFPRAHCNLGVTLMDIGEIDKAMEHFREALKIDPNDALAHYCMGVALSRNGKPDAAIEELRLSLELEPSEAAAHYELGLALVTKGSLNDSKKEFEEALRIDPSFAPAHSSLGVLAEMDGNIDLAAEHFAEAVEAAPNAALHYKLGSLRARQNRFDEAIEQFRSAIRLDPKYPQAHYDLGVALSVKGQMDEAIEQYTEAVKIAPKYAIAHRNLAMALYGKGDYAGAWKEVRLAQKYGAKVDPAFLKALAAAAPPP